MVNDLKHYCTSRKTPANPTDHNKWTMGNFVLDVSSRSTVNTLGNTTCGTEKKFGCTGKGAVYKEGINGTGSTTEEDLWNYEIPHKGAKNRCSANWYERGNWRPSRAERQGSFHALETDQNAINISGARRKGSAILQTEPLQ